MTQYQIGQLFAAGTAITWASSAMCFESAGRRIGSMTVNVLRMSMAVVLLGMALLVMRGSFWPSDASGYVWRWMSFSGVLGFFLCDMALFRAYVLIGARRAFLITTLAPAMGALLDRFYFHETLHYRACLGMLITLGGVMLVIIEKNDDDSPHTKSQVRTGTILALTAALFQALGAASGKIGMHEPDGSQYPALPATFIRALAGMICFVLVFVCLGWGGRVRRALSDRWAMSMVSLGAMFGPVLGVVFYMQSLAMIPTGITQTFIATIPVLMLPAEYFRGNVIRGGAIIGAILSAVGVAMLAS